MWWRKKEKKNTEFVINFFHKNIMDINAKNDLIIQLSDYTLGMTFYDKVLPNALFMGLDYRIQYYRGDIYKVSSLTDALLLSNALDESYLVQLKDTSRIVFENCEKELSPTSSIYVFVPEK